ncbi:virginiamycin B lyase family protein [Solirubrobacter ginsenosidimutans]|uniref:virginiamycin B lyase family protein n=1 Tax=Solirubrobacter ginsenosidimutans TaxID=490573 RepID=UPI00234A5693
MVAAFVVSASAAQASPRVSETPLRSQYAVPNEIVAGPDGAIYTSDSSLGKVWRIGDYGRVRSFDVGGGATGIASAHGALWVSNRDTSAIVKLALNGSQTSYPVAEGAFPADIVLGSDGALWFTELRGNAIGRLSVDGKLTEYPLPTADAFAADITPGPDGALWFTESGANQVGRITTQGVITEFTLPAADSLPGPIVAGADGALWFAERNTNKIARMTTDGALTNEFAIPTENSNPLALVAAPDGNLYFTQHEDGTIARMTYGGAVTKQFKVPSGYPDGLTVDGGGDLWFTQGNLGQVGRVDLRWDPPLSALGTTFTMRRYDSAERTVATFTDPDTDSRPGDYDVTIKWGDGTSSAGWVRRAGAGFEVRGRHVYDKAKTFAVTVKIDKAKVSSTAIVSR